MLREDFPLLAESEIVYLDSAASAQKPRRVLDSVDAFYRTSYANIHRGVYQLSQAATALYQKSREKVAAFIGASPEEIIFTRGTTESVNLVAYSWGLREIAPGDEILLSVLEHHSNFVPWQLLAERTGAKLRVVGLDSDERFDLEDFDQKLSEKTALVAVTQLSNAIGVETPLQTIIEAADDKGARVLVDGAQGLVHAPVNVRAMGADFYTFSGHKLYGPTGIGVLYAKKSLLDSMPPFHGGGDMVRSVQLEGTTFADGPQKFEAGTPNIAGAVGLGAAIDYLDGFESTELLCHEESLLEMLESGLEEFSSVRVLGPKRGHRALVSFVIDGIHPHDIAQFFDHSGIALRAGHHCAQPLMSALGISASTRVSLGIYNSESDVQAFLYALNKCLSFFKR